MEEADEQAPLPSAVSSDVVLALFAFTSFTLFLVMGLRLLSI